MGLSKQAKKKIDKSSIIEINDIKPFKKLQRTHTNLLVLFAQSGRYFTEDSVRCTDCRNAQKINQLVLICCFFYSCLGNNVLENFTMGTISYNYKISSLSYHDSVCTADINIFF